jgi:iron complex outermembrane recepter protein
MKIKHALSSAAWPALILGLAATGLATPALAQTPAPADDYTMLDDIVVTATRREERNQDVPIQITAFSAERLEQQGISDEQDLQANVPSLTVGPNGQAAREAPSFTLRGLGATFQASPGVVVYFNEVPLASAITVSQQGGPGNFVDLENMQVLAGPQGTLFGRNTTGGAVLLVPRKPTNTFEGWIQGRLGNYEAKELEGAINIPIVDDKLLVRVVGAMHDREGYTRDVVWNKDRDDKNWYSGRLGVTFRPTETVENYLMLFGSKSDTNGAGLIHKGFNLDGLKALNFCYEGPTIPGAIASCDVYRAATANADALGPRRTALSTDVKQETETWGAINTTSFELNDNLTLRNIVSFQQFKSYFSYDGDATVLQQHDVVPANLPAPGQATLPGDGTPLIYLNELTRELPRDDFRTITEELQLQGVFFDGKLTTTVGGFYFDQRPTGPQGGGTVLYCPAAFTGFCAPSDGQVYVQQKSTALYAQGTLDLGVFTETLDGLRLTAGYRHTWDKIIGWNTGWNTGRSPAGTVVCSATGAVVPTAQAFDACRFTGILESDAPTWTVGLDYKVRPNLMVFAKASRGYKSGGFNPFAVFENTTTFAPEEVTSYEAGFKSDFRVADMPLRLNATVFNMDYQGIQRATGDFNAATGAGGARTVNADATIKGIEIEASIRPTSWLEIGGNFSKTDAEYDEYRFVANSGQEDCNGMVAPGGVADMSCLPFQYVAPEIWSLHAAVDIPIPEDMGTLSFFANYSHTAAQYTEAVQLSKNQPGAYLEPFGLLNLSLDWNDLAGSGVDVGLWATNVTDETYRISNTDVFQQNGGLLYWSTLYGEPRMYGVKVRYKFGG